MQNRVPVAVTIRQSFLASQRLLGMVKVQGVSRFVRRACVIDHGCQFIEAEAIQVGCQFSAGGIRRDPEKRHEFIFAFKLRGSVGMLVDGEGVGGDAVRGRGVFQLHEIGLLVSDRPGDSAKRVRP